MAGHPPNPGYGAVLSGRSSLVFDDPQVLTTGEWLRSVIQNFRLGRAYVYFCVGIALLCIALMVYSVITFEGHGAKRQKDVWFLICEAAITLIIICETVADYIVSESCKKYWSDWWHVFDMVVCVLCVSSMVLDLLQNLFFIMRLSDFLAIVVLVLRYCAVTARLIWTVRTAQQAKDRLDAVDETTVIMCASERALVHADSAYA